MPTPVAHALAGWCIAAVPRAGLLRSPRALAVVVLAANAPDLDFLALLGGKAALDAVHQHGTHSLVFALGAALALAPLLRPRLGLGPAFGLLLLAGLSHLALDLVAFDARPPVGIPLLWPLSEARWHAGWTLFPGIDRSSLAEVASARNVRELLVELALLLPPALLAARLRGARAGAEANAPEAAR
jgi:membrane-bound metal-dependent hydrolase YbcI (DUF457 family)